MKLRLLAVAGFAALALVGCSATPPPAPDTTTTDTPTQLVPPAQPGVTTCTYIPSGAAAKPVDPPQGSDIATAGTLTFTISLTAGDVTITLDRAKGPCAVNSFQSLVAQGYFDNTECHRLVTGFMLQCGDPTATGRGGPGYRFNDELTGTETYLRGVVAMANAGPNTNGSQFFMMLADTAMPPNYDVIGTVDAAGMAVLDQIAAKGIDPTDPAKIKPAWGAHINSITAG